MALVAHTHSLQYSDLNLSHSYAGTLSVQVWQQMQAHMAALISQQQQQLQMGGMFQQPAQSSPFMPMSSLSSAAGAAGSFPITLNSPMPSLPATGNFPFPISSPTAAGAMPFPMSYGGSYAAGGTMLPSPMSMPGSSPSGIDPATWQGAVQAHAVSYSKAPPAAAVSMAGANQQPHELSDGGGGTVQYFGGTHGEVYCCFQGRWFQVRPESGPAPGADGVRAGWPFLPQGGGKAVMELEAGHE